MTDAYGCGCKGTFHDAACFAARMTNQKVSVALTTDQLEDAKLGRALRGGKVRAAFLRRLTVDSDHRDRRRKDYNQAIFNADGGWAVWSSTDLDMVMGAFDDAMRDLGLTAARDGLRQDISPPTNDASGQRKEQG